MILSDTLDKAGLEWEIVVADDGSTDNTGAETDSVAKTSPRIRRIELPHRGKGAAVREGMLSAYGKWRVFTDADLSTPPEEIQRFLSLEARKSGVMIGSREKEGAKREGESFIRRFISLAFSKWVSFLVLKGVQDTQCGFKMFSKEAAESIFSRLSVDGFGFDVETLIIARLRGFKVEELPITWKHSVESKVGLWNGIGGFIDIVNIKCNLVLGRYHDDEVSETMAGNDKPMSTSVIIPTYQEKETLPVLVSQLKELSIEGMGIIVVDDSSPDGTADLAEDLAQNFPAGFRVIRRSRKAGLRRAYVSGFRAAIKEGTEQVVQMDADMSHPVAMVPLLLENLKQADISVGSRYILGGGSEKQWGIRRKLLSFTGSRGMRLTLGTKTRDVSSGFKAFRTSVILRSGFQRARVIGFGFQAEVIYYCENAGLKIVEVPYIFKKRAAGMSKMSPMIVLEAMLKLAALRVGC